MEDMLFLLMIVATVFYLIIGFYYFGMSLYYLNTGDRMSEKEFETMYVRKKYHVRMYKFGFMSAVLGSTAVIIKEYYYFLPIFGIWAIVLLWFWIYFARILKEKTELNIKLSS